MTVKISSLDDAIALCQKIFLDYGENWCVYFDGELTAVFKSDFDSMVKRFKIGAVYTVTHFTIGCYNPDGKDDHEVWSIVGVENA